MRNTSIGSLLAALILGWVLGGAELPTKVLLEKPRAKVIETTYAPGVPRTRHIRKTDQVIVFLNDCQYRRKDSTTGEVTTRTRKAGEVLWHDKGEDAPELTNLGKTAYRTLTIELP